MPSNFLKPTVTDKKDITVGTIKDILAEGPNHAASQAALLDPGRPTDTPRGDAEEDEGTDEREWGEARKSIKAALAKGPMTRAQMLKGPPRLREQRPSVKWVKAAQANPLTMRELFTPGGSTQIDVADLEAIAARHGNTMQKRAKAILRANPGMSTREAWSIVDPEGTMRKQFGSRFVTTNLTLPRESDNSTWGDAPADRAGAIDSLVDSGTATPAVSHVGGFSDRQVSLKDPRITAAVALGSDGSSRDAAVEQIKKDLLPSKRKQLGATFALRPATRDRDDTGMAT